MRGEVGERFGLAYILYSLHIVHILFSCSYVRYRLPISCMYVIILYFINIRGKARVPR